VSQYTLRGSAELDARIDADLARIAAAAAPHSIAGVLLGGYGRGEGTPFINPDGSQSPFNDYDLVVIVDPLTPAVRRKFQALETQLSAEVGLPVDLCPYPKNHLPRCEFSMLNYEMKHGHKVVWGDENILADLPDYPTADLPLSEGARLLLNRGKLLLDIQQRLDSPEPLTDEERIRFIKFINKVRLAFGDCALLATNQYDPSYTVKKERIPNIENCPARADVIDGYLNAIERKEWGDFQNLEVDLEAEFTEVREMFLHFLPWIRAQVVSHKHTIPSWMREQLFGVLMKLLQNQTSLPPKLFYRLQQRFS